MVVGYNAVHGDLYAERVFTAYVGAVPHGNPL